MQAFCKKQSLLPLTCEHICVISRRDSKIDNFSETQGVEEEAVATDTRVVARVCKMNALEGRRC